MVGMRKIWSSWIQPNATRYDRPSMAVMSAENITFTTAMSVK